MEFTKGRGEPMEGERSDRLRLSVPREFRRGRLKRDERASVDSARVTLGYILEATGFPSYASLDVLDFGCGVKFTQALLQDEVPLGHYFGIDVHTEMIEYLQDHVTDPRFEYAVVPFQNDMYNPNGEKMTFHATLPCGGRAFDLITLQSVFTHLAPSDFQNLLHILRRYCKPDGRMFFTCFIDATMPERFLDAVPDKPLLRALYREEYVREMVGAAGWTVVHAGPRRADKHVVNHLVCKPGPQGSRAER